MKKIILLLLILFVAKVTTVLPQIVINEVSNANNSQISDEDGDYEDWIEIYNAGSQTEDLSQYALSDDKDVPLKWIFPQIYLEPGNFILVFASGKDRKPKTIVGAHWETAISGTDIFKYKIFTSEPALSWKNIGYNDASWSSGAGGLGFGDGDDNTQLPSGTISFYVRKTFTINDTSKIRDAVYHMDYDDGFVAYLNGTEIARYGLTGTPPAYNELSDAHEAVMYNGGSPEVFLIDDSVFNSLKRNGDNVLAIQVHNYSSGSSDLSCIPFLSLAVENGYNYYSTPPSWFDISIAGKLPHTNFNIKRTGEKIYLSKTDGTISEEVDVPGLDIDDSYGRYPDGNSAFVYFDDYTPDSTNNSSEAFDGYESAPVFTTTPGLYPSSVNVIVSNTSANGGVLRYTTDGNDPVITSALYNTSINVTSSEVIKVRCFPTVNNLLPSKIAVGSFLINTSYTVPIISITSNSENFWGSDGIIDNPYQDTKKPCTIEYFDKNGTLQFSQDAGIKIDGGAGGSRSKPQRSFRVMFDHFVFGDGAVNYPLIPDKNYLKVYYDIFLRNGSNFWNKLPYRDAYLQRIFKSTNVLYNAYTPVVGFINGQYFGVYEVRQKVNDKYMETNYNGNADTANVLSVGYYYNPGTLRVVKGSDTGYYAMIDYVESISTSDADFIEKVDKRLDVKNFVDYFIANNWVDNEDWLYNNMKIVNDPSTDNRWKFCLQDMENVYGSSASGDMFNYIGYYSYSYTDLYDYLWQNTSYRYYFINRYADLMNTILLPDSTNNLLNTMHNELYPEMSNQYTRWPDGNSLSTFNNEKNNLTTFNNSRNTTVFSQIRSHNSLSAIVNINVNVSPAGAGRILVNTIIPENYPWTGKYFNGVPITLTVIPNPGYTFDHWDSSPFITNVNAPSWTNNITTSGATFTANFTGNAETPDVAISEINYNSESSLNCGNWVELYNNSSFDINLSGWKLKNKDGFSYTISDNTVVSSHDYLVLYDNPLKFNEFFSALSKNQGGFFFDLNNNNDSVKLYNNKGTLVDMAVYTDESPYPLGADGTGRTLERKDVSVSGDVASNWMDGCILGSPTEAFSPCNDPVIFSEINYHPSDSHNAGDWVEIRNTSVSDIDISNWQFLDCENNHLFTVPAGTILNPNENLVIAGDIGLFNSIYSDVTNVIGPFNFGLNNDGEEIRLKDNYGVIQQTVIYENVSPWTTLPDGYLYTLEINDISGNMNDADDWFAGCPLGSPASNYTINCLYSINDEVATNENILIYPNPASNYITVEYSTPATDTRYEIFNILGKKVNTGILKKSDKNNIDISGLPDGIYMLKMFTDKKSGVNKFVKE